MMQGGCGLRYTEDKRNDGVVKYIMCKHVHSYTDRNVCVYMYISKSADSSYK